jgi:hypothetical protein
VEQSYYRPSKKLLEHVGEVVNRSTSFCDGQNSAAAPSARA